MYCTVIVGAGCKQTHYCTTGINAILSNYFLERTLIFMHLLRSDEL